MGHNQQRDSGHPRFFTVVGRKIVGRSRSGHQIYALQLEGRVSFLPVFHIYLAEGHDTRIFYDIQSAAEF